MSYVTLLESGDSLPAWPYSCWERCLDDGFLPRSDAWSALYLATKPDPPDRIFVHDVGRTGWDASWQLFPVVKEGQTTPRGPYVYVRVDIAEAEKAEAVAAAREKFAALIESADDLADDLMGRPRNSEMIASLIQEVAALRGRITRLRLYLLSARADATGDPYWCVSDIRRTVADALEEDDMQAAKDPQ